MPDNTWLPRSQRPNYKGTYGGPLSPLDYMRRQSPGYQNEQRALDIVNQFLSYETPEGIKQNQLGMLNQQLANQQTQMNQQFNQNMAAQTGGRLGSTQRGTADIGGQVAMAGQLGTAEILNNLYNQQLQTRLAGLQAYIQKYGIDKNAELALKQLRAEKDAGKWGAIGGLVGTGITALAPWLGPALTGGGQNG